MAHPRHLNSRAICNLRTQICRQHSTHFAESKAGSLAICFAADHDWRFEVAAARSGPARQSRCSSPGAQRRRPAAVYNRTQTATSARALGRIELLICRVVLCESGGQAPDQQHQHRFSQGLVLLCKAACCVACCATYSRETRLTHQGVSAPPGNGTGGGNTASRLPR